eukprot:TCONS_00025023-protein
MRISQHKCGFLFLLLLLVSIFDIEGLKKTSSSSSKNNKQTTKNNNKNNSNTTNNKENNNNRDEHGEYDFLGIPQNNDDEEFKIPDELNFDTSQLKNTKNETNKFRKEDEAILDELFCFHAHNYLRKLHGVPPFRWHSGLQHGASRWAEHLAEQNDGIEHKSGKHVFTENIHNYSGHNATCGVLDAIYSWYKTIQLWDFNTHVFDREKNYMALMFIQMIWDDSTRIGCGVARDKVSGEIFVVVRYAPSITDKSPVSMEQHVKPPQANIFNKTIDSKKIFIPDIHDLASHVPHFYLKNFGDFTCGNEKFKPREEIEENEDMTNQENIKASKIRVTTYY